MRSDGSLARTFAVSSLPPVTLSDSLSPTSYLLPPDMNQIVIIGGGQNGLVTAFYLARAGLHPLVLERRHIVGGAAVTEEFAPGFRGPTLAHATGPLRPSVVRDMALQGVEFVRPETRLVTLQPDGRALAFCTDE